MSAEMRSQVGLVLGAWGKLKRHLRNIKLAGDAYDWVTPPIGSACATASTMPS
jgi:hypothetical protein